MHWSGRNWQRGCLSYISVDVIKENVSAPLVQVRNKISSLTCYTSNDRINTQGKLPDSCYSPFAIWENAAILGAKMWVERKQGKKRGDYLVLLCDFSYFWKLELIFCRYICGNAHIKYIKLWVDHQDELEKWLCNEMSTLQRKTRTSYSHSNRI